MPLASYRVADLPTRGAEAFLPAPPPVVTPALLSSYGLVHVFGAPGTVAVPAPDYVAGLAGPYPNETTQSANVGPGFPAGVGPGPGHGGSPPDRPIGIRSWAPSIYTADTANMGPQAGAAGVRVRHHEDLPVPSVTVARVARPVQRTPPYLGGRVIPQPRVFARFRSIFERPA